jgi:hypothetical protein
MTHKDKLLDVPVEVLSLASDPPIIRAGRVTCRDEATCDVMLDDDDHGFAEGMKVIVDAGDAAELRVVGTVGLVQENLLHVESRTVVRRDNRIFPRMYGGIRLRYQVVGEGAGQAWIEQGLAPDGTCHAGDTLLLELRIPPEDGWYRATASVVRIFPIAAEDIEVAEREPGSPPPTHQIAVHFLVLPPEAVEALMAFTLRVQDALI